MDQQDTYSLTSTDKKIIRDLCHAYEPTSRVRCIREIFGLSTTSEHFLYLGECIGRQAEKEEKNVHRLMVLNFLN